MRKDAVALALALASAPLGARAADLVVWWDKGAYAQEDDAVREVIAAFEQASAKRVELVLQPSDEHPAKMSAALDAGQPPDFAFGTLLNTYLPKWALEDRLVDLSDVVGAFSNLFDPHLFKRDVLLNARSHQKRLYGLPINYVTNHLHVWKSLLEQAGFALEDIPKEWDAFWSFWCDRVQPAVRLATKRDDVWGIGLAMAAAPDDTTDQFFQFVAAYGADYVTRDGELILDRPEIRQKLIEAIGSYTAIERLSCTPPDSLVWGTSYNNNKAFLAQTVIMIPNYSLSTVNALKRERPDDYYQNTATIEWPRGPNGERFPIPGSVNSAMVFKDGRQVPTAKEFVRFLVSEGWLMHYLNFSGERNLPSIATLLDQPFWLDPSDPHRMASVMQASSRPLGVDYTSASGDLGHDQIYNERVWARAIHRVAADGIGPEQAVDEAIARIKQILAE